MSCAIGICEQVPAPAESQTIAARSATGVRGRSQFIGTTFDL